MNLMILGLAALPLGACAPACLPGSATVAPAPVVAKPVCSTQHGWMVDGHLVVTILQNADVPCDLVHGQQLNLVYNSETEGELWGSDASVEWAAQNCDDHGGHQFWVNDGDYRLVCEHVDF
jgi:hypothetical protein